MKHKVEQFAVLPFSAAKSGLGFGRSMVQQSLEIFFSPDAGGAGLAERIMAERPIHDAEIGIQAMKRAQKRDDPELFFTGEAYLANAVIKAAEDSRVPDAIVNEVVELVDGNADDDDIELCPLLSDDKVEQVKYLTSMYRRARPFIPSQRPASPDS